MIDFLSSYAFEIGSNYILLLEMPPSHPRMQMLFFFQNSVIAQESSPWLKCKNKDYQRVFILKLQEAKGGKM